MRYRENGAFLLSYQLDPNSELISRFPLPFLVSGKSAGNRRKTEEEKKAEVRKVSCFLLFCGKREAKRRKPTKRTGGQDEEEEEGVGRRNLSWKLLALLLLFPPESVCLRPRLRRRSHRQNFHKSPLSPRKTAPPNDNYQQPGQKSEKKSSESWCVSRFRLKSRRGGGPSAVCHAAATAASAHVPSSN